MTRERQNDDRRSPETQDFRETSFENGPLLRGCFDSIKSIDLSGRSTSRPASAHESPELSSLLVKVAVYRSQGEAINPTAARAAVPRLP